MNGIGQSVNSLGSVVAQHRELKNMVDVLCRTLSKPVDEYELRDEFAKLTNKLVELRDFMEFHLAQEALGGYLEEAVARLPRLGALANEIEREHPELLANINALIKKAADATLSSEEWQEFGEAVVVFVRRLMAHETA